MANRQVQILMGSESDAATMQKAVDVLQQLGVSCQMTVASAHRSPDRVRELIEKAPTEGVKVFIVGAGAAAHLAGVVAAHSTLPVIGYRSTHRRSRAGMRCWPRSRCPPVFPWPPFRLVVPVPRTQVSSRRRSWRSGMRGSRARWSTTRRAWRPRSGWPRPRWRTQTANAMFASSRADLRSASASSVSLREPLGQWQDPLGPRAQSSKSITSSAFWVWRRFSACSNTTEAGPSITESVTSSPRWAGRQCMKHASGFA